MKIKDLTKVKGIDRLIKSFDNVIYDGLETHQTLELSNNVKKGIIEKVIYIKLYISYSGNGNRGPKECLEGAIDDLLPWLDLLLNHDEKEQKDSQLTLFNEENIHLESEPEPPTGCDGWDKYHRNLERVRISNMKKQYKFFELFNPQTWWWGFHSINYKDFFPTQEVIEKIIYRDLELIAKDIEPLELVFDKKSLDNINELSNTELATLFKNHITIYFKKLHHYSTLGFDNSFTIHSKANIKSIQSLFKLSQGRIECNSYRFKNFFQTVPEFIQDRFSTPILGEFNFNTEKFIDFARKTFGIKKKEKILNKEYILDKTCCKQFKSILWYSSSSFDILKEVFLSKNSLEFRNKFFEHLKSFNIDYKNGGSGYYDDEMYSINCGGYDNKIYLTIKQNLDMYKEFNTLTNEEVVHDEVILYKLSINELIERVYKLYECKDITEYALKRLLDFHLGLNQKDISYLDLSNDFDSFKKSFNKNVKDYYSPKHYENGKTIYCETDFRLLETLRYKDKLYRLDICRRDTSAYEFFIYDITREGYRVEVKRCQGVDNILNLMFCNNEKNESMNKHVQLSILDFLVAA